MSDIWFLYVNKSLIDVMHGDDTFGYLIFNEKWLFESPDCYEKKLEAKELRAIADELDRRNGVKDAD